MKTIGLFDGVSVKTLKFDSAVVRNLTQENLDYLSTIHWNENIKIGDSGAATSFSKFYQNIKVTISADKENVDYLKDTQDSVTESLKSTYDKLVKVDKDEEMVNLIKFQAAYEANAKLVTIVDEMLQTILGMKR
jgi:flagellar hook-associated protein 1 FlgK